MGQVNRHQGLVVKAFGLVGITAGVALGALSAANTPAPTVVPSASSGHGDSGGTYVSPTLSDMTAGATATWTTPGTAAPTMHAVPPVKAAPYHG